MTRADILAFFVMFMVVLLYVGLTLVFIAAGPQWTATTIVLVPLISLWVYAAYTLWWRGDLS